VKFPSLVADKLHEDPRTVRGQENGSLSYSNLTSSDGRHEPDRRTLRKKGRHLRERLRGPHTKRGARLAVQLRRLCKGDTTPAWQSSCAQNKAVSAGRENQETLPASVGSVFVGARRRCPSGFIPASTRSSSTGDPSVRAGFWIPSICGIAVRRALALGTSVAERLQMCVWVMEENAGRDRDTASLIERISTGPVETPERALTAINGRSADRGLKLTSSSAS